MMFKTHIVISLLVALLIYPFFHMNEGVFLLVFLFAALLPDIDSSSSFIGKHVPVIGWLFRHRGVWHSVPALFILTAMTYILSDLTIAVVFSFGYLTHLCADALTHEGLQPLYPLSFRVKGFIRTNSLVEHLLFMICLVTGFYLLLR
jgi:membrane-bound metal-dependent hydrolase YbcI (DUF457 family)